MDPTPVFACDLSAMTPGQRAHHAELSVRLLGEARALEHLPNGYALVFESSARQALELAEWMAMERLCCPFLTLAAEFAPERGPLRLRLTGAAGIKPFLVHELGLDRLGKETWPEPFGPGGDTPS